MIHFYTKFYGSAYNCALVKSREAVTCITRAHPVLLRSRCKLNCLPPTPKPSFTMHNNCQSAHPMHKYAGSKSF